MLIDTTDNAELEAEDEAIRMAEQPAAEPSDDEELLRRLADEWQNGTAATPSARS